MNNHWYSECAIGWPPRVSTLLYFTSFPSGVVVLVMIPPALVENFNCSQTYLPTPELSLFKNGRLSNGCDIKADCCLISISLFLHSLRINFTCLWASQGSSETFWFTSFTHFFSSCFYIFQTSPFFSLYALLMSTIPWNVFSLWFRCLLFYDKFSF